MITRVVNREETCCNSSMANKMPANGALKVAAKPQQNQAKISKQGTGNSSHNAPATSPPFTAAPSFAAESHRIAKLEERFDQLEQRQVRVESKVDARFEEISSSLRQLLQASQTRTRDPSGETPAPKHARQEGSL